MRSFTLATAVLSLAATAVSAAKSNLTKPLSSQNVLSSTFTPPQVFKNVNLVHIINLEKAYSKESINVVIENIDSQPQSEYYVPFTSAQIQNVGGMEASDRKNKELGSFAVESVEYDSEGSTQYYKITLPSPLEPNSQQTLSINYNILSSLSPLPKEIKQADAQFLVYEFSAYWQSAYASEKQKTEVKFPSNKVPEFTKIPASDSTPEFPQQAGNKFTYGTFGPVPAGSLQPVRVRYEFTKPLIYVTRLERDIEVSHWGGNVAFEERYDLTNHAANLSTPFNRVLWANQAYYNPATTAIKELRFPLRTGTLDPYFTDVIGNVSTSRFRSNKREAHLEIKPRYPIFGGWNYPFRVGWSADLKNFARRVSGGERYVLNVPFLEGPKMSEGIEYKLIELKIILPEGAINVKYHTTVAIESSLETLHKTFMDTVGRTTLTLTARNVVDDVRDREVIVMYDYPFLAGARKPITITLATLAMFVTVYAIGSLDTSIKAKARK